MAGWMVTWGALVVLMVSAAVPTAARDLTIESMDWSYDETSNQTSLKVCTTESLPAGSTVTLTVDGTNIQDLGGTIDDSDGNCAQFVHDGKLPPPPVTTLYTLKASNVFVDSTGYVSFALDGATMDCGDSQLLRIKLIDEKVDGFACLPSALNSTCYVLAEDFTDDPICFSTLDQNNVKVCVQRVAFETVTPVDGTFTADALHYNDMSFNFTYDNQDAYLEELLILPDDDSSWHGVSCIEANCIDPRIQPAETRYDLCGVITDGEGTVVKSGVASFQDMNLRVEPTDLTVDFYFKNLNAGGLYFAYSVDNMDGVIENNTLDCSLLDVDDFCNGFFITDPNLAYVAVSNQNDESNKIVAPLPSTPENNYKTGIVFNKTFYQ